VSVPFNRRGEGRSDTRDGICDSQRIDPMMTISSHITDEIYARVIIAVCVVFGELDRSRFEVQSSVMLPHTASPTRKILLGSPGSFHVYLVYGTVPGHEEQLIRISR